MKIYIIVVTYNGSKWIDKCFGSLTSSSVPLKILAIDNASTDDTPNIIRGKFPQVKVIETGENLGFGKANNLGLKYALDKNADYAFLLNQDAYLYPDCLENMLKVPNLKSFGILSPIHLNGDGTALDTHFKHYISSLAIPEYLEDLILKKTKSVYECTFVNAAGWLLPINTILQVGGFDPIFYHYGEDLHYCQRVKFHEFKIGICPNAFMNHDRITAGNIESFKKNIERRTLLGYYLDVNKDVNKINSELRNRHIKNVFRLVLSFIRLDFTEMKNICDGYWFIVKNRKQIKLNRIENKKTGLLWM